MAITIDGTAGTIAGLVAGGLPDASIVLADLSSSLSSEVGFPKKIFHVHESTVTALNDGTSHTLAWNYNDFNDGSFSMSTNQFTIPRTGFYLLGAGLSIYQTSNVLGGLLFYIKNVSTGATICSAQWDVSTSNSWRHYFKNICEVVELTAGESLTVIGYADTPGGQDTLTYGSEPNYFFAVQLG
jgi:hypothetical protein